MLIGHPSIPNRGLRRRAVYSLIGRLSTQICRLSRREHPTDVGVRTVVDLNELIDQRPGQLLAMFGPGGEVGHDSLHVAIASTWESIAVASTVPSATWRIDRSWKPVASHRLK